MVSRQNSSLTFDEMDNKLCDPSAIVICQSSSHVGYFFSQVKMQIRVTTDSRWVDVTTGSFELDTVEDCTLLYLDAGQVLGGHQVVLIECAFLNTMYVSPLITIPELKSANVSKINHYLVHLSQRLRWRGVQEISNSPIDYRKEKRMSWNIYLAFNKGLSISKVTSLVVEANSRRLDETVWFVSFKRPLSSRSQREII